MEFTFEVTITINDADIDEMVELVRIDGWEIDDAIKDVISGYDDFEWYCAEYYFSKLKEEVERRLENE